jgi:hypothetical protein
MIGTARVYRPSWRFKDNDGNNNNNYIMDLIVTSIDLILSDFCPLLGVCLRRVEPSGFFYHTQVTLRSLEYDVPRRYLELTELN